HHQLRPTHLPHRDLHPSPGPGGPRRVTRRGAAALVAAGLLVAACSSSGNQSTGTSTTATTLAATPTTAAAGATTAAAAWPTYGHDAARTGAVASGPDPASARQVWTTNRLAGDIYAPPLLVGGRGVVATQARPG